MFSNNSNYVYPCKPQFFYIKVGCEGLQITRACTRMMMLCSCFFTTGFFDWPLIRPYFNDLEIGRLAPIVYLVFAYT